MFILVLGKGGFIGCWRLEGGLRIELGKRRKGCVDDAEVI